MTDGPRPLADAFRAFVRERQGAADPVYQEIDRHLVIETTGWAPEICGRAAARLNAVRAPAPAMVPVVFWFRLTWAFTCAGAYVYITRRLLERLRHEDAVAFVLAHEMAHHDLRHIAPRGALAKAGLPGVVAGTLIRAAENWARSEALERAADDHAIVLCEKAGYDRERCLLAFDILLMDALDHGDVDGGLGSDDDLPDSDKAPSWLVAARKFLRRRSHPPVVERRDRLRRR